MRVYYTGDIANMPGWFTAEEGPTPDTVTLIEEPGQWAEDRTMRGVWRCHIGTEYQGHCSPRFVTEDAYNRFYEARRIA